MQQSEASFRCLEIEALIESYVVQFGRVLETPHLLDAAFALRMGDTQRAAGAIMRAKAILAANRWLEAANRSTSLANLQVLENSLARSMRLSPVEGVESKQGCSL